MDIEKITKLSDDFINDMNIRYQIKILRNIVENKLDFFKNSGKRKINYITQQFKDITGEVIIPNSDLYSHGIKIATGYERIVLGGHGHYIEFTENQLCFNPIIKEGQEWRTSETYDHVKYIWLKHPEIEDMKIYKQTNKVKYADYKIGYYYIDILSMDNIQFKKVEDVSISCMDFLKD